MSSHVFLKRGVLYKLHDTFIACVGLLARMSAGMFQKGLLA